MFALLLAILPAFSASGEPAQIRAIFDEGMYWAGSATDVSHVLNRVKRAGFNTYIPCVWHGQGTTWPSNVAPVWDANPSVAANDALARFITAAHRVDIKVLPCFTLMLRQREFLPEFASESRPEGVFDVQNPEFRAFATKLVVEVVQRYAVDGINLDYVRAGQVCYDADCRQQYSDSQQRNLMGDVALHKVNEAAFDSIVTWQRKAVRALIEGIVTEARQVRPSLLVTVDAAPWADSVVIEGQDSLAWSEDGLVDLVFSMNYEPSIDWAALRALQSGLRHPERFAVMVANYDGDPPGKLVPRKPVALRTLVNQAAKFNPAGSYAVYIYSLLTNEQVMELSLRELPGG